MLGLCRYLSPRHLVHVRLILWAQRVLSAGSVSPALVPVSGLGPRYQRYRAFSSHGIQASPSLALSVYALVGLVVPGFVAFWAQSWHVAGLGMGG